MEQVIERVVAPTGEEIAYATVGEGPVLVLAAWWTSHLELDWQAPELRGFIEGLAADRRVVRYDRPGVGLSARVERPFDMDAEVTYLRAVVDATAPPGEKASVLGISCGGPTSVRFAVEEPDRIDKLILFGAYADGSQIADEATRHALVDLVRANWGLGSQTLTNLFLPDAEAAVARRFTRTQRATASPEVAGSLLQLTFDLDASTYAAQVRCPALVVHRTHDSVIPAEEGRKLADAIPGARFEELEGRAHIPWTAPSGSALDAISAFLGDGVAVARTHRELASVCFVDIVDSTDLLAKIGDARWSERFSAFATMMREEAAARGGTLVKLTGDGGLLRFSMPGGAVEFCRAIRSDARSIGLQVRAGVHTGEVEVLGEDLAGVAVVAAARVADLAGPDEILVTRTVGDLLGGGAVALVERGGHTLKGLDGTWDLFSAAPRSGSPVPPARSVVATAVTDDVIRFGPYEIDVAGFELRRQGVPVPMEPQVFEVLAHLARNAGNIVTKEQLLDEVWGDRFVSDSALSSRIRSARQAVGDDGTRQEVIKTVHGRGYRFVAPVG